MIGDEIVIAKSLSIVSKPTTDLFRQVALMADKVKRLVSVIVSSAQTVSPHPVQVFQFFVNVLLTFFTLSQSSTMLFPKPKIPPHKQKQHEPSSPRLPNLEMCSSSPLFQQVDHLFAIFRAMDGALTVQGVMSNRKRFTACLEEVHQARPPHMDTRDIALFHGARSLNSKHRDLCLRKVSMLKRTRVTSDTPGGMSTNEVSDDIDDMATTKDRHQARRELKVHYTSVLKNWIDHHTSHPFPTKEEKIELCKKASITERQLNNWFTNYRRRHLH